MHHALKTYGGIAPHIRKLGTRWRRVDSFMPRTLYPLVFPRDDLDAVDMCKTVIPVGNRRPIPLSPNI
jgi:hypothetical protein